MIDITSGEVRRDAQEAALRTFLNYYEDEHEVNDIRDCLRWAIDSALATAAAALAEAGDA